MTTSISSMFYRYAASLELPKYPNALVNQRAEQIAKKLEKCGWAVQGYQIIGSYSRGTMIRPLDQSNVDVMIELDEAKYRTWNNPESTRHILRVFTEQLSQLYREPVEQRSHEIGIQFPEFRMDVIPAMHWHGGRYLIPDATEEKWLYTDPDGMRARIHEADQQHSGLLIPLIKLVKDWNRSTGYLLEGLHIESMLMRRYNGTCRLGTLIGSLPVALCDFFLALPSLLETHIGDPVHNQRVDLYLDGTKNLRRRMAALDTATYASGYAGAAYESLYDHHDEDAMMHFGKLLNQEFLVPVK